MKGKLSISHNKMNILVDQYFIDLFVQLLFGKKCIDLAKLLVILTKQIH